MALLSSRPLLSTGHSYRRHAAMPTKQCLSIAHVPKTRLSVPMYPLLAATMSLNPQVLSNNEMSTYINLISCEILRLP